MSGQKISFYDESLNVLFSSETSSDEESSIFKVNSNKEDIAIIASNDFSFYKFDSIVVFFYLVSLDSRCKYIRINVQVRIYNNFI